MLWQLHTVSVSVGLEKHHLGTARGHSLVLAKYHEFLQRDSFITIRIGLRFQNIDCWGGYRKTFNPELLCGVLGIYSNFPCVRLRSQSHVGEILAGRGTYAVCLVLAPHAYTGYHRRPSKPHNLGYTCLREESIDGRRLFHRRAGLLHRRRHTDAIPTSVATWSS